MNIAGAAQSRSYQGAQQSRGGMGKEGQGGGGGGQVGHISCYYYVTTTHCSRLGREELELRLAAASKPEDGVKVRSLQVKLVM